METAASLPSIASAFESSAYEEFSRLMLKRFGCAADRRVQDFGQIRTLEVRYSARIVQSAHLDLTQLTR